MCSGRLVVSSEFSLCFGRISKFSLGFGVMIGVDKCSSVIFISSWAYGGMLLAD